MKLTDTHARSLEEDTPVRRIPILFLLFIVLIASVPPLEAQIHRTPDPVRRADLERKATIDRMVMGSDARRRASRHRGLPAP